MPTIEVDDEVFAKLQGRAVPFVDTPNDVIRRLLAEVDGSEAPVRAVAPAPAGRLSRLIRQGLVRPGDKVRHQRKRTNEIFEATITEGGCLQVEGVAAPFREPSPALRHFTGSQIDGWHNWTHVGSQRTLRELRDQEGR
ncbi:hypothetical protein ACQPZJ_37450 [Actinoplanes sp. CA-054009]